MTDSPHDALSKIRSISHIHASLSVTIETYLTVSTSRNTDIQYSFPSDFGVLAPPPSLGNSQLLADYLGRISSREDTRRKVTLNDRTRGHYGVISDLASGEHHHATTQPDVRPDYHWSVSCGMIRVDTVMICVIHRHEFTDKRTVSNFDAAIRYDAGSLVDENALTDE